MCFSPQRRAIFRHLNFQKWSKHAVFCTFWLANVLFATAACNFWFLLWAPTSAPAALTGDWPDTRIIEKTQHFATSLTFGADVSSFFWLSRYCIFCRLTWRLYCGAMHLLFNCPYCRKFLFKLPSMIPTLACFKTNAGEFDSSEFNRCSVCCLDAFMGSWAHSYTSSTSRYLDILV